MSSKPRRRSKDVTEEKAGKQVVKVNFAAAASGNLLDEGEYPATLTDYTVGTSQKGQPTINVEWTLEGMNGRKSWRTFSLQPNALWSLRKALIAMGADPEFMASEDADIEDVMNSVRGARCILKVGQRTYMDEREKPPVEKTTNDVQEVLVYE